VFEGPSAQGAFSLGSPRRQPRVPSMSECRFNKSSHHQKQSKAMAMDEEVTEDEARDADAKHSD